VIPRKGQLGPLEAAVPQTSRHPTRAVKIIILSRWFVYLFPSLIVTEGTVTGRPVVVIMRPLLST